MTNKSSIINWLRRYGQVTHVTEIEVKMKCVKCGHDNFYFNVQKGIGFCHRARCNWKPTIKILSKIWGTEPSDLYGWTPVSTTAAPVVEGLEKSPVELPQSYGGCRPLVYFNNGNLMTDFPKEVDYVKKRGLTVKQIYHWGIQRNDYRIYVPVYSGGNLVQYVGRLKWWEKSLGRPKYKYAKGKHITNYLFGWDEQDWSWMTLVENTIVSIGLREDINCTTNFGSNLSSFQVNLIVKSKVKEVILLWDQDAEWKMEKSCEHLRKSGVNAKYIRILGQPDNYPKEIIIEMVSMARLGRNTVIDMRDVCATLKH